MSQGKTKMEDVIVDMKMLSTCRMCITQPGKFHIIPQLREQISECFKITVEPYDMLSQIICNKCKILITEINSWINFFRSNQEQLIRQREEQLGKMDHSDNVEEIKPTLDIQHVQGGISPPNCTVSSSAATPQIRTLEKPTILKKLSKENSISPIAIRRGKRFFVKYNCIFCNKCFPTRRIMEQHTCSTPKHLLNLCQQITPKIVSIRLEVDPKHLPYSPPWIHMNSDDVRKFDHRDPFYFNTKHLRKQVQPISLSSSEDEALDPFHNDNDHSDRIWSPVKVNAPTSGLSKITFNSKSDILITPKEVKINEKEQQTGIPVGPISVDKLNNVLPNEDSDSDVELLNEPPADSCCQLFPEPEGLDPQPSEPVLLTSDSDTCHSDETSDSCHPSVKGLEFAIKSKSSQKKTKSTKPDGSTKHSILDDKEILSIIKHCWKAEENKAKGESFYSKQWLNKMVDRRSINVTWTYGKDINIQKVDPTKAIRSHKRKADYTRKPKSKSTGKSDPPIKAIKLTSSETPGSTPAGAPHILNSYSMASLKSKPKSTDDTSNMNKYALFMSTPRSKLLRPGPACSKASESMESNIAPVPTASTPPAAAVAASTIPYNLPRRKITPLKQRSITDNDDRISVNLDSTPEDSGSDSGRRPILKCKPTSELMANKRQFPRWQAPPDLNLEGFSVTVEALCPPLKLNDSIRVGHCSSPNDSLPLLNRPLLLKSLLPERQTPAEMPKVGVLDANVKVVHVMNKDTCKIKTKPLAQPQHSPIAPFLGLQRLLSEYGIILKHYEHCTIVTLLSRFNITIRENHQSKGVNTNVFEIRLVLCSDSSIAIFVEDAAKCQVNVGEWNGQYQYQLVKAMSDSVVLNTVMCMAESSDPTTQAKVANFVKILPNFLDQKGSNA